MADILRHLDTALQLASTVLTKRSKHYLKPGETPPKGSEVHVGKRKGRFIFTEGRKPQNTVDRRARRAKVQEQRRRLMRKMDRLEGVVNRLVDARRVGTAGRRFVPKMNAVGNDISKVVAELFALDRGSQPASPRRIKPQQRRVRPQQPQGVNARIKRLPTTPPPVAAAAASLKAGEKLSNKDYKSMKSFRQLGFETGIHGANTFAVDLKPGVMPHDPNFNDTRCVFKAVANAAYPESNNEVAAYKIDQILGWNICPTVQLADFKGKEGHVMRWVDEAGYGGKADKARKMGHALKEDPEVKRQIFQMRAYDMLLNNTDRHESNWMIDPDTKKVWTIDNGFAFSSDYGYDIDGVRFDHRLLMQYAERMRLPPESRQWITEMRDQVKTKRPELIAAVEPYVQGHNLARFKQRLDMFERMELP